ncbi:MAG: hypothetical protein WC520_02410 [Candidatus Paceibacterota bacterium]
MNKKIGYALLLIFIFLIVAAALNWQPVSLVLLNCFVAPIMFYVFIATIEKILFYEKLSKSKKESALTSLKINLPKLIFLWIIFIPAVINAVSGLLYVVLIALILFGLEIFLFLKIIKKPKVELIISFIIFNIFSTIIAIGVWHLSYLGLFAMILPAALLTSDIIGTDKKFEKLFTILTKISIAITTVLIVAYYVFVIAMQYEAQAKQKDEYIKRAMNLYSELLPVERKAYLAAEINKQGGKPMAITISGEKWCAEKDLISRGGVLGIFQKKYYCIESTGYYKEGKRCDKTNFTCE